MRDDDDDVIREVTIADAVIRSLLTVESVVVTDAPQLPVTV